MRNNTAEDYRSVTSSVLASQELRMPDDNPRNQRLPADYASQGSSPNEELREIARIHHREAKELLEHSQQAKAEGRDEEAKLLMDLWVAREARAVEFEKAARGEGGDPIVTEILDWQEDLCENYTPHSLEFFTEEELAKSKLPDELESPPQGRIDRAFEWLSTKQQQCTRRVLVAVYSFLKYIDGPESKR
jgi:hypothetical protein